MDALRKISETYSSLNKELTWKSTLLVGGAVGAAYTTYCFAIKPYLSPLRKIPGPDYGPLFGNVREAMVGEAMQSSIGWVKKYGGIVRFYHLFGRERVLIADPEALKHILVTNVDNYARITVNPRLLGSGIFNVSGEAHRFQRRLMNPFFNHQHIQSYLDIFKAETAQLISLWKQKLNQGTDSTIEIQEDLMRMTLDAIGQAVFGYEFKSLNNPKSEAHKAFRTLTGQTGISFTSLIPYFDKLPTEANNKLYSALKVVDDVIYSIIAQKKKLFSTEEGEKEATKDFLGKLMLAKDVETGKGFSDRELRDQVLGLMIAGHETTAATMSWILLLFAQHEEIQSQVREEIQGVLPDSIESVTWDHLDKLTYFNAALKEGQRLYPAAPSFYRRAVADDTIKGYFIPKGTLIAYHVGAMMRNPAIWPEPDEFKPERFLDTSNIDLYTHIPFLTGPHTCLGNQFAKMEMRTVLTALLKEFHFKVIPGTKFTRKLRVTLKAYPSVTLQAQVVGE